MLQLKAKGEYGDVMERALYNTVTAGIAGDGKHYFYVNPMEVWPEASERNPGKHHVKAVRQKWYGCACCPPNVARILSSLAYYIFTSDENTLYTHLYIANETEVELSGRQVRLKLDSGLPWKGEAKLTVAEAEGEGAFTLAMRVPGWSKTSTFSINGESVAPIIEDGYAYFNRDWRAGDVLTIELDMEPQRIYAHPNLRANAGRVALQRGPLVYCFEETDNGAPLASLTLPATAPIRVVHADWRGGVVFLEAEGQRIVETEQQHNPLYRSEPYKREGHRLLAVPYTLWGNRDPGEMLVWIRQSE
jgi:DUF1680 family protein